jgi:PIN like domain
VTEPLRLYFDECLSIKLARELAGWQSEDFPPVETRHLFDDFLSGAPDIDWIPQLARGNHLPWIVISKDRGMDRRAPQLPRICHEHGVPYLIFTSALACSSKAHHAQAIKWVIPRLYAHPLSSGHGAKLGFMHGENRDSHQLRRIH